MRDGENDVDTSRLSHKLMGEAKTRTSQLLHDLTYDSLNVDS